MATYFTDYEIKKSHLIVDRYINEQGDIKVCKQRVRWIAALGDKEGDEKVGKWYYFTKDGALEKVTLYEEDKPVISWAKSFRVVGGGDYSLQRLITGCRIKKLTKERVAELPLPTSMKTTFHQNGVPKLSDSRRSTTRFNPQRLPTKKVARNYAGEPLKTTIYNRKGSNHFKETNYGMSGKPLEVRNFLLKGTRRVRHGMTTTYHYNGSPQERQEWCHGLLHGWTYRWDESGQLEYKALWRNGNVIEEESYSESEDRPSLNPLDILGYPAPDTGYLVNTDNTNIEVEEEFEAQVEFDELVIDNGQ